MLVLGFQRLSCCGGWRPAGGIGTPLPFAFLIITTLFIMVEGRFIPIKHASAPMMDQTIQEKTLILRSEIGSRPPICVRRCYSCEQCEAIQVPGYPRTKASASALSSSSSPGQLINLAYARGDHVSNYKPMSWKCKCGTSIYNP